MDAFDALETYAKRGGMVVVARFRDRFREQLTGRRGLALLEELVTGVQHLLRAALPLGYGGARAIDIGAGTRVRSIEEEDARPEMDGFFVPAVEVFVEAVDQERFDLCVTLGDVGVGHRFEASWIGHQEVPRIISAGRDQYKRDLRQRCGRTLPMALIECIPNISEGRRNDVLDACASAIRSTGARLLDVKPDTAHNRTVFTFAGEADVVRAGVLALFDAAVRAIDLRQHAGEHPRIGAVDVVPFVPIEGATMSDCVELARQVAREVSARHNLPVFLYEEAASSPGRRNLEDIRRGEFEGLAAKLQQAEWRPDFGPAAPHPSAGASVIGARMPLIAYNINLATNRLDVARRIAAAVRQSSGGLRFVKAMGVELQDRGIVQVSMNLTNFEKTPMFRVFELVKRDAERYGVNVLESEIVGLVPAAALTSSAAWFLQLDAFTEDQILETKLRKTPVAP